ncbi:MAG: type II toxin-antitoxin system RelE/ParE family toxin [Bacteroidota bacterium]
MVTYKVSVSDEAKGNLRQIYEYLEEEVSLTTAEKVRDGLLDAIADLANMPQRHGLAKEIQNDTIIAGC